LRLQRHQKVADLKLHNQFKSFGFLFFGQVVSQTANVDPKTKWFAEQSEHCDFSSSPTIFFFAAES